MIESNSPPRTVAVASGDPGPSAAERCRSVVAAGVGNVLEWFDWAVYALLSTYISAALFDGSDPVSALLGTLAVFAVGFVMRPLGGYVFGRLADRRGRRWVLVTTMTLMAAGSLAIAVIPDYTVIGGFASLLLLVARLAQGFAHGGESTISLVYLPEIAPARRRALYGSTVAVAMGGGTLLSTLLGAVLANTIPGDAMSAWGWRIPFAFGALLALVVLWLRRNMIESEVHTERRDAIANGETVDPHWSRGAILARGVQIFLYMAGATLPYYIWSAYAAVFAVSARGMDQGAAFVATLAATVLYLVATPLVALLSDRFVGRKIPVIVYYLGTAALTFPMMAFIGDDPWTLFIAQGVMLTLSAGIGGTQAAMVSEQVPTRYRTAIMGTALPLAVALFGGTAPYLNSWLYSLGLGWASNLYVVVVCLISASVVAFGWRETRGIELRDVR
jgi:MFS transporter, MHS family, alpha-ketoglutarate permease